ncbi:MAG: 50S ribosomal protein L9 [Candidatus Krumholzibacteriia bacterium]
MDVILLKSIDKLGKMGDTVSVARGHARNYLLPQGLAVEATEGARKMVADKMVLEAKRDHKRKEAAEVLAAELVKKDLTVTIGAKVAEEGRLYGSVSVRDIAEALASQKQLEIEHQQLILDAPLKELGEYELPLRLHADVQVSVKVLVTEAE